MQIKHLGTEALKQSYSVKVPASDIETATQAELLSLGKKVKIPGFRSGHIPMKVLQQRYGSGVREDVLKNVVENAVRKVISDNKLRPALQPDVKVEEYKDGGELSLSMAVESLPVIPDLAFDKLSLTRDAYELSDEDVTEGLQRIAENNPELKELPATAKAKTGNVVTMDFKGMLDGTPFEGGTSKAFDIELGSGRLIPGFEDQLVGVKAGDEKNLDITFPKDYFNQELAGKKTVFEVKVLKVSELATPEMTDAFAKAQGMKDLAALKDAVKQQMEQELNHVVRTRLKKRLFDALEDICTYDLPQGMVKMEFDSIWGKLDQARKTEGESVFEGKSEKEMKEEYHKIAERRVRLGILLAELGARNKLQVTREELTQALMVQARGFPGQEQRVFDFYKKNPQRLDDLRGPILEEKAVDWIFTQAKISDKKVSTKELMEDEGAQDAESGEKATASEKKAAPKKKASSAKKKDEAE